MLDTMDASHFFCSMLYLGRQTESVDSIKTQTGIRETHTKTRIWSLSHGPPYLCIIHLSSEIINTFITLSMESKTKTTIWSCV